MASLVENELGLMPSILALACAVIGGDTTSRRPTPAAAAANAAPPRNFRRVKYKLFGVISDQGISTGFLISIKTSLLYKCTGITSLWIGGFRALHSIGRTMAGKVANEEENVTVFVRPVET